VLPSLRPDRREDVALLAQWLESMVAQLSSHDARRIAGGLRSTDGLPCALKSVLLRAQQARSQGWAGSLVSVCVCGVWHGEIWASERAAGREVAGQAGT